MTLESRVQTQSVVFGDNGFPSTWLVVLYDMHVIPSTPLIASGDIGFQSTQQIALLILYGVPCTHEST